MKKIYIVFLQVLIRVQNIGPGGKWHKLARLGKAALRDLHSEGG